MSGSFSILGAGRLGRALGRLLAQRGLKPDGISCRTRRSARRAAATIGGGRPTISNSEALGSARLVLVATPDGAIQEVAREILSSGVSLRGRVIAHTSGALPSTVLQPLRRRGAAIASLHPLMSVADSGPGRNGLRGVPCALEGDARAVRTLRRLVVALGGVPFIIPRGSKVLYHLIACLLSNDLVALLACGYEAARGLGLKAGDARRLYAPLVAGTVANVARLGPVKALTGPVSRGDLATLRLHTDALRRLPADVRRVHKILALRCASLALEAGTLTPGTAARTARLLASLP